MATTGPRVCIAYLHPGTVRAEFMDSVLRTIQSHPKWEWSRIAVYSGADITRGRNAAFEEASRLVPEIDYLWFLDADSVFEPNVIDLLLEDRYDDDQIRSALVMGQHANGTLFPAYRQFERGGKGLRPGTGAEVRQAAKGRATLQVAAFGMACVVIPRKALMTMRRDRTTGELWPFAEVQWPEVMGYGTTEDDVTFCLRAMHAGFERVLDIDAKVGHVKDRVVWP